jgi:hypothetical protein
MAKDDEKDTAPAADEPKAAPADVARFDLMEQAKALQFLARQAEADAMRLPDRRLDEIHDKPLAQVFERVGPDGKVYARVNANGEPVKD